MSSDDLAALVVMAVPVLHALAMGTVLGVALFRATRGIDAPDAFVPPAVARFRLGPRS